MRLVNPIPALPEKPCDGDAAKILHILRFVITSIQGMIAQTSRLFHYSA
jgi:hypothetical protein